MRRAFGPSAAQAGKALAAASAAATASAGEAAAASLATSPLIGSSRRKRLGLHDDWQSIFLVGGVLPILLIVPLLLLLPPLRVARHRRPGDRWQPLFAPGSVMPTLLLWSGFFFGLLVVYLLLNWLPQLLVSRGFERGEASLVQIAFNLGAVAGSLIGGRLIDGPRPALLAAPLSSCSPRSSP